MKKQERVALAKKCYDEIISLGLTAKIEGEWILLSPPQMVSTDLLLDMAKCDSDYLKKLLEHK